MENIKISINYKIIEGPWGGGNRFVKFLAEYLKKLGYSINFSLKDPNIDLILMINPNEKSTGVKYGLDDIKDYLICHPNTLLIHRINISSERGSSPNETQLTLDANQYADFTVFISSYLRDLYISRGFNPHRPYAVILNGADETIFNPRGGKVWNSNEKLRIVTHHWSNNYMKGFDIYERLDLLIGTKPFSELFEFTFIGNKPLGLEFKQTKAFPPTSGFDLAQLLKQHHIYLTASRNEPAGMHHIEGVMCGLPVLYLNSGALPEYCSPYGIEFNLLNFEQKLLEIRECYFALRQKTIDCSYKASKMAAHYESYFNKLILERRNNPLPPVGVKTLLKHYLIAKPSGGLRKYWRLVEKARQYLK